MATLDFEPNTKTKKDMDISDLYSALFEGSQLGTLKKLENFVTYVKRQDLTYFISKYELFKKVLNVHGSIIECGVLYGGSLFAWASLSAILEPLNHNRKVIGFDTFSGFTSVSPKDGNNSSILQQDGMNKDHYSEIIQAASLFEKNKLIPHIPKVQLVKGDICITAKDYVTKNPHLVVSLLHLDCDIYEPTKEALRVFVPRMPKGAIIVFDELNSEFWPGETLAVLDEIGIRNLEIKRLSHDTMVSYAII